MTRMPDAVEIEVVAGSGVEGARRATGGPDPATTLPARAPDPEVPATVQRRRFSAAYRLRILKAVDACKKPGEVGALLRRDHPLGQLVKILRFILQQPPQPLDEPVVQAPSTAGRPSSTPPSPPGPER